VPVNQWIERYRRAWETADADEVVDLFTPNASYRSSVFREPFLGREAIHRYWQRGVGTRREVAVRMGRPIITEDRVAVEWRTTMIDPDEGEITLLATTVSLSTRWSRVSAPEVDLGRRARC
jgi:hypothetical protein